VDCQVTANQVSHPPLPATVPVPIKRPDVGDPIREVFNTAIVAVGGLVSANANPDAIVSLLHGLDFESGLGGGIFVRNASATRIARCHVGVTRAGVAAGNRARHGGGIACFTGAYPRIEDCEIANNVAGGDGGGISIDQFDPVLPPGVTTAFGVARVPFVPRLPIELDRNRIHDNYACEDGGGVYATGGVRLAIKGGSVSRNRAEQDGGGIRATFASNLYAEGATIASNQSNVVGSESDAGGGVSARNAHVTLRDCELTGNVANAFAGGAVYFASMWEGGIVRMTPLNVPRRVANQRGTFDQIMEAAAPDGYDFHTRVLRLIDCRASGNKAMGDAGAGGFAYAVRSAEPLTGGGIIGGGEPMWVVIEGDRTRIGANESHYTRAGLRKRGNVVIELSATMVGSTLVPQDRVWIDVPAGAIARSVPEAPVPTLARAAVVMINRDVAQDRSLLDWDGTGFVYGQVPAITAVAPAAASTLGGTALTITGTGFDPGATVLVGPAAAPVTSVTATTITVVTAPGPPGPADVMVISPSGPRTTRPAAVTLVAP
jgi:hypothetical protein